MGIHYGVAMNRFAFASCVRPHRRYVSGCAPFFETNDRILLVDANFDDLSTVFLINTIDEQIQVEYIPAEFYSMH